LVLMILKQYSTDAIYLTSIIIFNLLGWLLLIYYLWRARQSQQKAKQQLKEQVATLSHIDLHWINSWMFGILSLLLLDFISSIFLLLNFSTLILIINVFFVLALIWYLGYYGFTQQTLFVQILTNAKKDNIQKITILDPCTSEINQRLQMELERTFKEEEYYKLENISLRGLAAHLNTTDKKLS